MTFPGGAPGGFPGQQPQQGPGFGQPQQSGAVAGLDLTMLLSLAVTVFSLISYFCGFADEAAGVAEPILLGLVAGLLAATRAVPRGPRFTPVMTVLSVVTALWMLLIVVHVEGSTPGIIVVLLIMSIVQMLISVAALLFELEIMKPPAPKPYGGQPGQQQFPQSGQFPQQTSQFPPHPQQPQQPGQYGQPGQQTTFAPQQGQFGQQPPGTPPGGFSGQG